MNKVKKTGLWGRLKAAARAFRGKPAGSITFGLEIKRCSECGRGDCAQCCYKQEFEKLMALPSCNDCSERTRGGCGFAPRVGEFVRINCPLWEPEKEAAQTEE